MVTGEGVFPKVGNDPLYASEVNDFFRLANSHNLCSGLTPASGGTWTSGPTQLTNITDEDYQTSGTQAYNTGNQTGYIWIDLQSNELRHTIMPYYSYMISGPGGYGAGEAAVVVSGTGGITTLQSVNTQTYTSGVESGTIALNIVNNRFRYVGFKADTNLAGRIWFTPFEIMTF